MKTYGGSGCVTPPFLTSALDGGEWSASRPCRFIPRERVPGNHSIGGWAGPRTGPESVQERKILRCRDSNLDRRARYHVAILTELSRYLCFLILVCVATGTAATPGLLCQPRVIVKMIVDRSRWNADWQGKPKFSEKTCPSATFVHHKIPHDKTRFWTGAAAVGSRRLPAWAMARPLPIPYKNN
jgi:hypothetical protein